jgi:hypothetical protein
MTEPQPSQAAAAASGGGKRLALWLVAAVAAVVLLTLGAQFLGGTKTLEERRTIDHTISR